MSPSAEYDAIKERVERARLALNAVPWWRPIKRQNAAEDFKYELLRGAFWEIDHGIVTRVPSPDVSGSPLAPPTINETSEDT